MSCILTSQTSFYLPKNVSKGLFLTSKTTSQEVISILLRKFKIVTNPRKFALFECNNEDGGVYLSLFTILLSVICTQLIVYRL